MNKAYTCKCGSGSVWGCACQQRRGTSQQGSASTGTWKSAAHTRKPERRICGVVITFCNNNINSSSRERWVVSASAERSGPTEDPAACALHCWKAHVSVHADQG